MTLLDQWGWKQVSFIRSTLQLIKPVSNVRASVCPQKVYLISVNLVMYVEVSEWCTRYSLWSDPRSRWRALQSWKSGYFQQLSPLPFTVGAGNWPLILKLWHFISISPSFCVIWLCRNVSCEESTVSPVGANLFYVFNWKHSCTVTTYTVNVAELERLFLGFNSQLCVCHHVC